MSRAVLTIILLLSSSLSWAQRHEHTGHGESQRHADHQTAPSLTQQCSSPFALPSAHCAKAPMPAFSADGRLWLSFASHGHVYVTYSSNGGQAFSTPIAVNPLPEPIYADGENRPKLAFGADGEIYVSWTRKLAAEYSGEIRFSRSLDGGASFETPRSIIDQRQLSSHRFDTMTVDRQQRLYLAWIDKRDEAAAKATGKEYAGAAVYYAVSNDRGATFSPNTKLVDNSCECCRMSLATAADGRVHVLWRHIYPGSARDNAAAVLSAGAIAKNAMRISHDAWQVEACPHHGPDLSLDKEGRMHVAWFNGGGKRTGLVYGRFDSSNAVLEQDVSVDASAAASHPRVLVLGDTVYLAWKRFTGDATEIRLIVSTDGGASWSPYRVAANTHHDSDQMFLLSDGEHPYLSWRTDDEGYRFMALDSPQMKE